MDISGYPHALTALIPGKNPSTLKHEPGWTRMPVWVFWRKEKSSVPIRIRIPNHSSRLWNRCYTDHVTSVPEFHPRTGHEGWPWSLYPLDRNLVPTVQETGWDPVLFWSRAEILLPKTGFNPHTHQSVASHYTRYADLTNKTLKMRYTEHIRYTRSNNPTVAYAVHILNNCHEYGLVDEIMELAKTFTAKDGG